MKRLSPFLVVLLVLLWATNSQAQPQTRPDSEWSGTPEEKVWGLMTVWAQVRYTFPHFDRMPPLDWDGAVQACIPRVIAAEDIDTYYEVLSELVAQLNDGHTFIIPPWGYFKPGYDLAPIEVQILSGRFYVAAARDAPDLVEQGILPGTEILEVDGVPVSKYFAEHVLRYHSENTRQGNESMLVVYLLYGPANEQPLLKIRPPVGDVREASVVRDAMSGDPPFLTRMIANAMVATTIETTMLPGDIVYVEIPNFDHDAVAADFSALIDTLDDGKVKGMIIDVRYNMGGSNAIVNSVVSSLIDDDVASPTMRFRHFIGAYEAWGKEPVWETAVNQIHPRVGKRYLGPLTILVGGLTQSSAEDLAIELRSAGRATLVGQTTAGSAGNGLVSTLPGGGTLNVSTFTALLPGGEEYVGVGVAPDVEITPTPEDLALGRDAVLERAREMLAR
jgi:C-terminal processing protease CtpA/Prc